MICLILDDIFFITNIFLCLSCLPSILKKSENVNFFAACESKILTIYVSATELACMRVAVIYFINSQKNAFEGSSHWMEYTFGFPANENH